MKKTICYGWISSRSQNADRQIQEFHRLGYDDDQIVIDAQSGKNFDRPGYESLKGPLGLRPGDTLIIKELDRLGRNKEGIKKELEYWKKSGVQVQILDLPVTTQSFGDDQEWIQDMISNLLIEVMASLAEQERKKILSRQREGIDTMLVIDGKRYSRKTNRPMGRPTKISADAVAAYYSEYMAKKKTRKQCADALGVSIATFDRALRKYRETLPAKKSPIELIGELPDEKKICHLCGLPLLAGDPIEYVETARGDKLFFHAKCVKKKGD